MSGRWQRGGGGRGGQGGHPGRGKASPYSRGNRGGQGGKQWSVDQGGPRNNKVDGLTHNLLKLYMEKNWNGQAKALNLANVAESPDLKEVSPDFNKPLFCQKVCKIIAETEEFAKNLESINLAGNKIYTLKHFCSAIQSHQIPLQNLCLSNNAIKDLVEVDNLVECRLREVMLDGNPIASKGDEYHRYVVKKLKSIQLLDTVDVRSWRKDLLPKLPDTRDSFSMVPEQGHLVIEFCRRFFGCIDQGDFSSLSDAYINDAIFSYTMERITSIAPTTHGKGNAYHSRLFQAQHNLRTKRSDTANIKCKRDVVIGAMRQFYGVDHGWKCAHNVDELKIDCFPLNDTILCTVHGSYKYFCSDAPQTEYKKCFDRTFLLTKNEANTGWPARIANDMVNLRAIQGSPILMPPENPFAQVKRQTGMNDNFVARLLEQTGNDVERALAVFFDNQSKGAIPPEAFVQ
eukprot:TRINITY_DN1431_c0_g1_i1.p1 TRINITY_DN1431_c0_g1~~TRINITY_DN1431_c0_g1_i1.p1  ORF type:complete len:458 (+),score=66.98 TRINITY_DN1431_c0_g1_i1:403-1776(+)